ncbi:hypothetical protein D3C80_448600 [compost metagenome]
MRILICILALIGVITVNKMTDYSTDYTKKQSYSSTIVEKWEDWSGEAINPYKATMGVQIGNTLYYENVTLSAKNYAKAVPGDSNWSYTTNQRDLGVIPSEYQKKMATMEELVGVGLPIAWLFLTVVLWFHWMYRNN